jgi:hypothetical protein
MLDMCFYALKEALESLRQWFVTVPNSMPGTLEYEVDTQTAEWGLS